MFLSIFLLITCNKTPDQKKEFKNSEQQGLKNILGKEDVNIGEYSPYKDNKFDFNDKKLYENLKKAIYEGDTLAYKSASKHYIVNGRYKEFLYYAILMAEKNNYKEAYWDISTILASERHDSFTSKFGTYSLLRSYELGDKGAKQSVKYIYMDKGKEIPKSNSIYCSE
ncbi:hypothetical protein C1637_15260 [Chryseobacterium lactis]|uniref:Sel1 repeat family protein n=2 Tax=Chryseobacterium lactis TaxID=1241981 RepID=A0A3G6RJ64_CHRLC|nr:hypothetical protein EG342_17305 [Chryseobacterium lactis]AZB03913.1 hypothetical protein EG341_08180 [Chryseobacterium lactis]PNW13177.1 hypothetical protein C1637_15260 [Chryseobacterium lactis]